MTKLLTPELDLVNFGSTLPPSFSAENYVHGYKDLLDVWNTLELSARENWAKLHFLACGCKEGSSHNPVPYDFCPILYLNFYQDLIDFVQKNNMNDEQKTEFGRQHYINHGRIEGRLYKLPEDFDPLTYVSLYDDLIQAFNYDPSASPELVNEVKKQAQIHYINNGEREFRQYLWWP
eukprot:TRINITY_DN13598_c0_g1_i1.p1 TRINITY_DN13598_c0_g1~~TRINITY_DN13598_c0_g1_i1.p1  ORF type:complete len:177 (+),score=20.02 TRINITY_DN13598_c0_g1_i1:43-573(+)